MTLLYHASALNALELIRGVRRIRFMRISEMHPVERPRERLMALGAQALADSELVALLLRAGYAGRSALELARELTRRFPRGRLALLSPQALRRIKGLGLSRAAALAAAAELGRRWALEGLAGEAAFEDPARIWEDMRELRGRRQEHFVAFYLDARNRLIHRETVSIGTLTASLVHPREVFAPAVERRAAALIVSHNHPSGDPRPSRDDRQATRRIARAGRILGIRLLDHVLVTENGYFSFRREGCL